ncbi:MAG: AbrB/MazE/SpoVT family DNA-binding domain-containing protein [Christensenellaceae bacterium]|nr:AbrB/MazE/SpoVT family DNA-binding domain-containing protein [Christensenellaceae bacterium]
MRATGIVRRIDDLGRVVVPKEIRRTLRIREGDPLEIFTDKEGSIVLRKYSPIGEFSRHAEDMAAAMGSALGQTVIICDRDSVISAGGEGRKDYLARPLSRQLENALEERTVVEIGPGDGTALPIYEGEDRAALTAQLVQPVLSDGQVIGGVVVVSRQSGWRPGEAERKSARLAALYLGAQMSQ